MARRDVDAYFKEICNDYRDMVDALHDLEEEANKGLVSPDRVELMKKNIEPIKANWMRISYIMYLLNRPTKKKKHARYDSGIAFNKEATLEGIHEENKNYIEKVRTSMQ